MTEKEQKFSLDDAVSAAWANLLENFWPYLGLWSLAGFLSVLPMLAGTVTNMNPDWWALTFIFSLLGSIIHVIAGTLGRINIQIRIVRGKPVSSDDLWGAAKSFFPYLAATLFYWWVVTFGLCFLIVPGIIFSIMFMFYPYFMAEHKLGPIGALKASAAITSGAMWELFFLNLILGILKLFAPLAFIVGIIPAHMFSELAITQAYRILLDKTPAAELPFAYSAGTTQAGSLAWDETMGYDESLNDAQSQSVMSNLTVQQETEIGETIKVPDEPAVEAVLPTVDNEPVENDKSSQEH